MHAMQKTVMIMTTTTTILIIMMMIMMLMIIVIKRCKHSGRRKENQEVLGEIIYRENAHCLTVFM
jgi:heme/copper-type cytochrome/quinol oxidase subunit 2